MYTNQRLCSYGETTLTPDRWEAMKALEMARLQRLPEDARYSTGASAAEKLKQTAQELVADN